MLEWVFPVLEEIVTTFGAAGIFIAMFIETIFPPIPSEIVMPLAGYIANTTSQGQIGLIAMILAGAAGSTLGNIMIYTIARKGGRPLILKYGKKLGVDKKKVDAADSWFGKYGAYAVFFCRMAPGLRELISIPAGIARMNFWKYSSITFAGSVVWSAFLGGIGFYLASWEGLGIERTLTIFTAIVVLSIVTYFIAKKLMGKKLKKR